MNWLQVQVRKNILNYEAAMIDLLPGKALYKKVLVSGEMDINERAKKTAKELYLAYLKGEKEKAMKLAEELYNTFSAATGTLLDKQTSIAVEYAGELWINGKIELEKAKEILEKLQKE